MPPEFDIITGLVILFVGVLVLWFDEGNPYDPAIIVMIVLCSVSGLILLRLGIRGILDRGSGEVIEL